MAMAGPTTIASATGRSARGALSGPALWITVFAGAFVFIEPSPYEFGFLLLCWTLMIEGVRIPSLLAAPIVLLALFSIGGITSLMQVIDDMDAVRYVAVSIYLCITLVIMAAYLAEDPAPRLRIIRSAYILGASVAAMCGIVGYFAGIEMFTLYGRASGTFKDPNVFAPFLILPALLLAQDVLAFDLRRLLRAALPLTVILIAILLSFSRGAWAHLALSGITMAFLMLITTPMQVARLRLVLGGVIGMLTLVILVSGLLSVPQVRDLFVERADFQYYDVGETGRFGKHQRSIPELLERPLGYGPMQFGPIYKEDPHNVYINAVSAYGWLGGASYMAFVLLTLIVGLRMCFAQTPWREFHLAAYAAFVGVAAEGAIIDTDHWRHFFLLAAIVWGLSAAGATPADRTAHRAAPAALSR